MSNILTSLETTPDKFIITHVQDEIPTIQANQAEMMFNPSGFTKKRLMRKMASIPSVVVREAEKQGFDMNSRSGVMDFLKRNPQYKVSK